MPRSAIVSARAAHLGPERRRPQILDAALAVALRDGLGAVTVVSVAHELNVTRPVVYAAFADRVDLLHALLDRETHTLLEQILRALRSPGPDDDPQTAFVTGFRALLSVAERSPDSWRLLLAGDPGPELSVRFRQARSTVSDQATAWIGPAMTRWWGTAELERKLPVLIEFFMSSCESAIRSYLAPGNTWTADDLGDFLGRAVFRAFEGV